MTSEPINLKIHEKEEPTNASKTDHGGSGVTTQKKEVAGPQMPQDHKDIAALIASPRQERVTLNEEHLTQKSKRL